MKLNFFWLVLSISIFLTIMVNADIYMQYQGETDQGVLWSSECDMYSNKNRNLIYFETENVININQIISALNMIKPSMELYF